MNWKITLRYLAEVICLAVIYHLAARLGLQMAYVQQNTSPVWPPSGIALAALLLFGIRLWPGIALGVVLGSLFTGAPIGLSVGFGLANTLEALIGATLIRRWIGAQVTFSRIGEVGMFVAAAACGTAVSAGIGVTTLILAGRLAANEFFTVGMVWFIGNLLGCLVITPFLMVWARSVGDGALRRLPRARMVEAAVFLALLIAVSLYIFENPSNNEALHQALIYIIFPFAIWAALRMELRGAVTTVFIVSSIAIWGTVHELGPFAHMPLNDSLIQLQTFTAVVALTSLMLAASSSERRQATEALRTQVDELGALNDASRQFLENIDKQALYAAICQLAVERLDLSAAWIELLGAQDGSPERDSRQERGGYLRRNSQPCAAYPTALLEGSASTRLRAIIEANAAGLRNIEQTHRPQALGEAGGMLQSPDPAHAPGAQALAAFPLLFGKELVGLLTVAGAPPQAFTDEQMLLLQSYANLAAAAIQNAWLFEQVRLGNEQLHALSHRLMEVQEAERVHLSRELHDESGQILAAFMMNLGLLERDADSPTHVRAHTAELKRLGTDVLNDLHALAVRLRPASLDHLGLVTAIEQYIQEFNRQYGLDVQFETVGLDAARLPGELETALFRIVQESLTNVALHACASRVDVLINRRNGSLVLTVEDNGVGFDPTQRLQSDRLGLFGMRERVEMLGGILLVESAPGKGTTISVEVPYGG